MLRRIRSTMSLMRDRLSPALSHPALLDMSLSVVTRGVRPTRAGKHILVAAPGKGNIGDVAMLEAFVERIGERAVVILEDRSDYPGIPDSVHVVALPGLIYGGGRSMVHDAFRLANLMRGASSLSVVGADIMDGAYNSSASARRSIVAKWAALSGLNSRVLGFSWNGYPHPHAIRYLRQADGAGTRILARDPESRRRLDQEGLRGVESVADIVFTATSVAQLPSSIKMPHGAYAVVNASALLGGDPKNTESYAELVTELVTDGVRVVLLPHVVRAGGDQDELVKIYDALHGDIRAHVQLVEEELTPSQVRTVVQGATFVATARMHLSIMALRQGVPAVVVATQGKVEGLMTLFGISEFLVHPSDVSSGGLSQAVRSLRKQLAPVREKVHESLTEVLELASDNFDGLEPHNGM